MKSARCFAFSLLLLVPAVWVNATKAGPPEVVMEITKQQGRLLAVSEALLKLMDENLPLTTSNRATYTLLDKTQDKLSSVIREFDVLMHIYLLASLVTEEKSIPSAKAVVDLQKTEMSKRMSQSVEFIEKNIHLSKDKTVRHFLLLGRDDLRGSLRIVEQIQFAGPQH